MSKWRSESTLAVRYLGSGVLNTVAGFAVIFALMAVGVSPMVANVSGYAVGFVLGFVVSKRFVFRSDGQLVAESLRYVAAFLVCFLLNLLVLSFALNELHLNQLLAQVLAAISYTISMYGLTRHIVFRAGGRS